jgi:hypothetical protein
MYLAIVITGVANFTDPELIVYGGAVVAGTKANPDLVEPWGNGAPPWTELDTRYQRYCGAVFAAQSQDTEKIKARNEARAAFVEVFKRVAAYAEFVANGNVELLLKAGFQLRHTRSTPSTEPPAAVTDLRGFSTEQSGTIEMHASKSDGALGYEVQATSTDPATTPDPVWGHVRTVYVVQKFMLTGLSPGFVWVRIRAGNVNGESPWSAPVRVLVAS